MTIQGDVSVLCRWVADQDPGAVVALACAEHRGLAQWQQYGADNGLDVVYRFGECLSQIPAAAAVEVIASGAERVVTLLDGCERPEDSATNTAAWAHLLTAGGRPFAVTQRTDPPVPALHRRRWGRHRERPLFTASTVPLSRRRLLRLAGNSAPPSSPQPRLRTVLALRRMLGGAATPNALYAVNSGAPSLEATGCTGSGLCARTCAQGALTLHTRTDAGSSSDEYFELTINASQCLDCTDCVALCPQDALSVVGELSWGELVDHDEVRLAGGVLQRCTRCRAPFGGGGSLCEVCAFRRSSPFGSWRPPPRDLPGPVP